MKLKIILKYNLIIILLIAGKLFAQDTREKKIKLDISGFIKNDIYYDSRQNVEAVEGLLHIYPKNVEYDERGKDINAKSSVSIIDISSRIGGTITGPDVLGAKLTGYLEVDFTGGLDGFTSRVRLRHAYSKLNWEDTEVLIGREWHPMFVKEVFPSVISLNTGIPFQPFSRSPMLQLSHKIGDFKFIGAAIYQSDYANKGPDGKSSKYIRNSNVPDIHLQIQYKPGNFLFGVAGDYKRIQPRTTTESLINEGMVYTTDKVLESYAWMGYFKFQAPKFVLKAKAIYGQNLSESVMPGGYGVSSLDSLSGREEYTPFNHFYSWLNMVYGDKTKIGLFGGYTKNMGANDPIIDANRTYGMALDVDYFYRVTPTISHKIKNFMLALELEHTVAAYGTMDIINKGKVKDSYEVSNTRIMFSVFHFF